MGLGCTGTTEPDWLEALCIAVTAQFFASFGSKYYFSPMEDDASLKGILAHSIQFINQGSYSSRRCEK